MATARSEQGIRDLMAELEDAWNRNDAAAYAALFTPDGSYTTFMGTVYVGREDIERSHHMLFARFLKGSRMFMRITSITFCDADVAVVLSRGDVGKKPPRSFSKVQTFTVVREGDQWRIAAFHNTKRRPLMEWFGFRMLPETRPRSPVTGT